MMLRSLIFCLLLTSEHSNAGCSIPIHPAFGLEVTDSEFILHVFNYYKNMFLGKAIFDDPKAGPGLYGEMYFRVLETFKGEPLKIEKISQANPSKYAEFRTIPGEKNFNCLTCVSCS